MLEIVNPAVTRIFVRCRACAGEPVPEDLPPLIERVPMPPLAMARFSAAMLPLDYKAAQLGEREPGCDDE
jgi:hypothetical protein